MQGRVLWAVVKTDIQRRKYVDSNPFSLIFKLPVFLLIHSSEAARVREQSLGELYITLYTFLLIFMDNEEHYSKFISVCKWTSGHMHT